jgi:hypothetical protein
VVAMMADPLLAQFAADRLQSAAFELVVEAPSERQRQKPRRTAAPETPPEGNAIRSSRR